MNPPQTNLLEDVKIAFTRAENAYITAAVLLHKVFTTGQFKALHETFKDYCEKELSLTPSKASKLLAVGKFVNENQFKQEQLEGASYTTVYEALQLHKGEEPGLILAEAKTNTLADIRKNRRDKEPCDPCDFHSLCVNCWKEETPA